ncbi:MAG: hypothetical protein C4308_06280 [Chitinophagaceae bacterium]
MKLDNYLENELEKTLASLDGIQRAEANPYLFTRILAQLRKENNAREKLAGLLTQPVVALATFILIIAINTVAYFSQSNDDNQPPLQKDEQLFASEYNLSGTTIYDQTLDQQ